MGSLLEVCLAAGDHLYLEWSFDASLFELAFDDAVFDATVERDRLTFVLNNNVGAVALNHS